MAASFPGTCMSETSHKDTVPPVSHMLLSQMLHRRSKVPVYSVAVGIEVERPGSEGN